MNSRQAPGLRIHGMAAARAHRRARVLRLHGTLAFCCGLAWAAEDLPKPYTQPCTERENVFGFTEKPAVRILGEDRYEITFAVKGYCDVTVALLDEKGVVVRHLASGVLGGNAPAPLQKNSLKQTLLWNGKDDLDNYVKAPQQLRIRVALGLKPEFDKRLGVTNPKSIPGAPWGLCSDESGVYLFFNTHAGWAAVDCRVRKFDHDGHYVRTLFPPPADAPEEKFQGLGWIEFEAGRRALHTPELLSTYDNDMSGSLPHGMVDLALTCRPAIANGRLYYCASSTKAGKVMLHYIRTDGAFEAEGAQGRLFVGIKRDKPFFAASPDGKWLYLGGGGDYKPACAVFRCSLQDDKPGEAFLGEVGKPGSDETHFNSILGGIDCDGQGRIYVCDQHNNRIQVFTPDGKFAKTIPMDRPAQIAIHRKTGALYAMHTARVQGASVNRICKLSSYADPAVEFHLDCPGGQMALDSWTEKPRLWIYDGNVRILEEDGKRFRLFADFSEEVKAEVEKFGGKPPWKWSGTTRASSGKVVCDPVREQAWTSNQKVFDLRTGRLLLTPAMPAVTDDIAFDKRGYLHDHLNPGFSIPAVVRLDPSRTGSEQETKNHSSFYEVPYDYGEEKTGPWNARWLGALPVRDQPGAKFFQDGIGVNMTGDVAENCNIYYAPKMEDEAASYSLQGIKTTTAAGHANGDEESFATQAKFISEMQKRGETVYFIRRQPGVPLLGATIWTFDRNGELRDEGAVIAGDLINGVMIDEEGCLYFVNNRTRMVRGKPFLAGQGGRFGAGPGAKAPAPFTGTLIKTGRKAGVLATHAPIPLDEPPNRPADFPGAWCEGAEWLYAGASGIVPGGCSCPTMRIHTDWHRRTYVPEKYRHSIGVLDTAGNLILHLGRYGNFDSGYGGESKVPVGGDGVAFSDARMISGTDNYLCFIDRGERILVLKLNYHAEETVPVPNR